MTQQQLQNIAKKHSEMQEKCGKIEQRLRDVRGKRKEFEDLREELLDNIEAQMNLDEADGLMKGEEALVRQKLENNTSLLGLKASSLRDLDNVLVANLGRERVIEEELDELTGGSWKEA
ncbi:hypothetical protein IQ06DRAFT_303640 [Phaeosphaeriaceae sp. SRC1lsM3a]|nr:hypothetical protein IQ06DRAFT_303640 [Stagonospora sp. SRC1lsM3a]